MKKTKIICSVGPISNTPDVMEQMVLAGMNVARINFSHATIQERQKACDSVREVRKRTGENVAILWDTKGPEFRCGVMENDGIELIDDHFIDIVKDEIIGTSERFSVNHPQALDSLSEGSIILLENAKMKLEVIKKYTDKVTCKIINGGHLGSKKSLSVPGVHLDIPFISKEDEEDLIYACEHGGEFIALSFVSTKEDVLEVKELLKKHNREDFRIICKIESALGIENLEEILTVSDGIMVARGDLGTEVKSEMVPIYQKQMIKTCRMMGKIAIVATEMLETMMENMRPKRAETSDIANAVLDGVDAVMLSGETTVGQHPVETVKAMASICETTEEYAKFNYAFDIASLDSITKAIASDVVLSTDALKAKLICAATITGRTARVISNLHPSAPILALTPDDKTSRYLALNWGVYTKKLPILETTDMVLTESVKNAKEFMPLNKGDYIILTGGFPNTTTKQITNLMKIEQI